MLRFSGSSQNPGSSVLDELQLSTEEVPITPSPRHCSNKYKLAREGEKGKEKDIEKGKVYIYIYLFFMMKSSSVERDEFSVVA